MQLVAGLQIRWRLVGPAAPARPAPRARRAAARPGTARHGGGGTTGAGGGGTPTVGGIFEQPEPWTKDVSGLTKDARSDAIITALGMWGGGNKLQIDFSIPLFFADSTTPRQTITAPSGGYCYGGPDCEAVPLQMPLPANGYTEGSNDYTCDTGNNDCHVLVVERSQKKLDQLYNSTKTSNGFTALVAIVWDRPRPTRRTSAAINARRPTRAGSRLRACFRPPTRSPRARSSTRCASSSPTRA